MCGVDELQESLQTKDVVDDFTSHIWRACEDSDHCTALKHDEIAAHAVWNQAAPAKNKPTSNC